MSSTEDNEWLASPPLVEETLIGSYVSPVALNVRVVSVIANHTEGVLPTDLVDEVVAASPELEEHPELSLTSERLQAAVQEVRAAGVPIHTDSETGALHIPTEE